jgi:hypothetical protein
MEASGQIHAPAALLPGKGTCYTLNRRLGGPQIRDGVFEKDKNLRGSSPGSGLRNHVPSVELRR